MSDSERAERSGDRAKRENQGSGLLERLRSLLGMGAGSVRDDIEDALEGADHNADFTPQERAILKNVLALHDVRVQDVMVPRADIIALPLDMTVGETLAAFRTAGHSRLPVFGETLDDPRGMVHIRDFVDFLASEPKFGLVTAEHAGPLRPTAPASEVSMDMPLSAASVLRPVLFAPPSMPALDLLVKMQASRTHMALVIDEYGGTDGLVSIEDVVEAIVGDIEDEHDEAEHPQIAKAPGGAFIVEARAPLDDVSEAVGYDFSEWPEAADVESIGGLIAAIAGRVPARGEIISGPEAYEFEVLDADPRRLKRLKLHPRVAEGAAPALQETQTEAPAPPRE